MKTKAHRNQFSSPTPGAGCARPQNLRGLCLAIPLPVLLAALIGTHECARAQTWTKTSAPTRTWVAVASSANGHYLFAAPDSGLIYSSTNSGVTWNPTSAPNLTWIGLACSQDGTKIIAAAGGYNQSQNTYLKGGIFRSVDAGQTWSQTDAPVTNWWSVACSADGTNIAAAGYQSAIELSANSGSSWLASGSAALNWISVASSSDGTRLVAAEASGGIYVSTNSGGAWTQTSAPLSRWESVASSADGTKLVAAAFQGGIYASKDGGGSWNPTSAPISTWQTIASSRDGNELIAGTFGNSLYTSTNSGGTWSPEAVAKLRWWSVAESADGAQLVAVDRGLSGGGIYVFHRAVTPALSVSVSGTDVRLSWPAASQGYTLQEGSAMPAGWTNLPTMPVISNLEYQVTVPVQGSARFFRLRQP